jgi:tryptophanase
MFKVISWGNEFFGNGKGMAVILMAVILYEAPELDDLEEDLAQLRALLDQHKIEYDNSTYLVGGVCVW